MKQTAGRKRWNFTLVQFGLNSFLRFILYRIRTYSGSRKLWQCKTNAISAHGNSAFSKTATYIGRLFFDKLVCHELAIEKVNGVKTQDHSKQFIFTNLKFR